MASGSWDKRTEQMGEVLETNLKNDAQTTLQTSMLHSFSTWLVMYMWRLCDGQSLFQVFLVVIFMDKVWEFLNFVQYIGYVILISVNVITVVHVNHIKNVIGIK